MESEFDIDIRKFVELKKENNTLIKVKSSYYELLKKYHPDLNNGNIEYFNQCTLIINYVYSEIIKNSPLKQITQIDEYDRFLKNGSYTFVNRDGRIEKIKDKSLFLYKMGLDKIFGTRDYLCNHPLVDGYGEEIVLKASENIFEAIKYLKKSIEIGISRNWIQEAEEKISWAYDMNNRISKAIIDNKSKEVIIIRKT
jgi:hypothetical protein